MDSVTFAGNELTIGKNNLQFDKSIQEIKVVNNVVIVLLNIPMDDHTLDNVYGVSFNGKILWRIQEPNKELIGSLRYPYVGISHIENKVGVIDFYGRRFFIDEMNGRIRGKDFVK
ncbi:hypothetical protein V7122_20650 [Bacillus sp. JJ1532]|uniref:hypothetical protein n=2 Tax=Bacillus TaxID=1386 RepID=UPI00300007F9